MPPRTALAAAFAALATLTAACAAPQQPGFARVAYTGMATVDGGFLGAITGIAGCSIYGGGENAPDKLIRNCAIAGMVIAAPLALYGTLEADKEPDLAQWLVIPIIPAIYAGMGIGKLISAARD